MNKYSYYKILIALPLIMWSARVLSQSNNINPHEFSSANWEFSERCNPCHIYNSETESSASNFIISFETDSLSAPDSLYISGISKLCYTCHDGTVAVFSHNLGFSSSADDGMNNAHPVSVKYNFSGANKTKLYNPDSASSGLGGTIAEDMLKNGRIECTSCHDAHFSMHLTACSSCPPVKPTKLSRYDHLSLWTSNRKSSLCLICHKI